MNKQVLFLYEQSVKVLVGGSGFIRWKSQNILRNNKIQFQTNLILKASSRTCGSIPRLIS